MYNEELPHSEEEEYLGMHLEVFQGQKFILTKSKQLF